MTTYLDFEKPIAELEGKVEELRRLAAQGAAVNIDDEVTKLETKAAQLLKDTYSKLTPWQKTQVARHPQRPPADGDRPREGQRHQIAPQAQFRHGDARRLSQGRSADDHGRKIRLAG